MGIVQDPCTPVWLDGLATLRADGADTETFLQGQLSSDLRLASAQRAQFSSYNSPKGRMLALLVLWRRGDAVELQLPRSIVEGVSKRLRMFVLRSKVQLRESEEACLGLRGGDVAQRLAAAGLPAPANALDCEARGGVHVLRWPGATPRYLLRGARDALQPLADSLGVPTPAAQAQWAFDDVLAGLPVVLPQTQDHFVPQMANLDQLGGISFDKGCYTGQEIVARLHYLGQLKRRMFLVEGDGEPPEPGSAIHDAADGGGGQAVGEVVQSAARPQGGFAASAVLQLAHAESTKLQLGTDPARGLSQPRAYHY